MMRSGLALVLVWSAFGVSARTAQTPPAPPPPVEGTPALVDSGEDGEDSLRASVAGRVLHALTGAPMAGARVTLASTILTPAQQAIGATVGERNRTTTDVDGRFRFDVDSGPYRITAEAEGYFRAGGPEGGPGILMLALGQILDDLVVRLAPGATIAGRVLDGGGDPVGPALVTAFRERYVDGQRISGPCDAETRVAYQVSEDGRYRLSGLEPGTYRIAAGPDLGIACGRATYYPSASDISAAVPLRVTAGGELLGIDVEVSEVTLYTARFEMAREEAAEAESSVFVEVVRRGAGGVDNIVLDGTYEDTLTRIDASTFETPPLPPGRYELYTRLSSGVGQLGFDIVDGDLADAGVLELRPPVPIRGRIRRAPNAGAAVPYDATWVIMTPHGYPNPASVKLMRPDTAGAFSGADDPVSGIAVIPQGRYRVDVKGLPAGFFVASVNYGSQNVSYLGALEVTSTTAASMLDILVDGPGGRLEGVVLDRADAAVSDARVVLAPSADLRQNSSLFLTAFSDQAGRFSIDGIPPGSYGILAWSDVSEGAWLDPEFLAAFETRMERLQIGKGDMESLVLEVIPWIN